MLPLEESDFSWMRRFFALIRRSTDWWLAKDPEDVPVVGRRKYPASAHILLIISSKGDVMPPHSFKKGEKVTKEVYLNMLQTVVKPGMDETAGETPYVFQQHGTPAHTSHLVQNGHSDNLDLFWTNTSGLLTPLI